MTNNNTNETKGAASAGRRIFVESFDPDFGWGTEAGPFPTEAEAETYRLQQAPYWPGGNLRVVTRSMTPVDYSLLTVTTPACPQCGRRSHVEVEAEAYERWRGGALIQRCFPLMPVEQRELLMTGFHPACWIKVFGVEDDE